MKCPTCVKYGIKDNMGVWSKLNGSRVYLCIYCNNVIPISSVDKVVVEGD